MSWPVKNVAYTFYVALIDSASRPAFKANPTLAAGDVKVSIDGGAFANITTLPDAEPDAGRAIRVQMSQSEMNGNDIIVQFVDAAGAEWDDLIAHIQTTTRGVDDLAFPTTSGRSIDVTATGGVGVDWGNVENQSTAVNLSGTNIDPDQVVASVTGAVGSVTGNVGGNVAGSVGSLTTNNDKTGYRLSATGVDDIHDEAVDGAVTLRESVRLQNSAAAGKLSGAATTNVKIRDLADTKDRIDATVDADGNRTAVTRDAS